MRFRIEQVFLTDDAGQVVPADEHRFHVMDATTVEQVLKNFVSTDRAEIVGSVLRLPGLQAIATVRRAQTVYTLQVNPASDMLRPSDFLDEVRR